MGFAYRGREETFYRFLGCGEPPQSPVFLEFQGCGNGRPADIRGGVGARKGLTSCPNYDYNTLVYASRQGKLT